MSPDNLCLPVATEAVLCALDMLVLQPLRGGGFQQVGKRPAWAEDGAPESVRCLLQGEGPHPLSFLGSFLVEAQAFWAQSPACESQLASGPWCEAAVEGVEKAFEAQALAATGALDRPLLLIQMLGNKHTEEHERLQRIRAFKLLASDIVAELERSSASLRMDRDQLEELVAARVVELEAAQLELQAQASQRRKIEDDAALWRRKLAILTQELARAKDSERRFLATAIHDGMGQLLALIRIQLSSLRRAATDHDREQTLDEIQRLLDEVIHHTRNLTHELGAPGLDALDLDAGLGVLVEGMASTGGMAVRLESDGQPKPLESASRRVVLQAVRELLWNVSKHAQATSIHLASSCRGGVVRICVEDDGKGFDPMATRPALSFGLFSVRHRLEALGGKLEVVSAPDQGTRVFLEVPLVNAHSIP